MWDKETAMRKLAFLFAALGGGCFTMVNEHSAEVLQPGSFEFLAGAILDGRGNGLPAVDAHVGLLPRMQVGVRWDILSLAVDTRLQLLEARDYGVDVCLEGGVGTGLLPSPFWYVGVGVSKRFELVAPYFHVRYMETAIDLGSGGGGFLENLYAYTANGLNTALQLFVGAEVEVTKGVLFVPEVVIIPTLMDDKKPYVAYNVGLRFRLGAGRPPPPAHADEIAPVSPSE